MIKLKIINKNFFKFLKIKISISFPILKSEEIFTCLFQVNLNFSEKNIKFPITENLKPVFDYFISYFTGKKIDQVCQIEVIALDRLSNPELHEESFNTLIYFRLLQKMAKLSGPENFSLRDYFDPISKRIKLIVSALINFGKFKEEICFYTKIFDHYTFRINIKGNYSEINTKIFRKKTQKLTWFFKACFIYLLHYHRGYKIVKFFLNLSRIEIFFGYFREFYNFSKINYITRKLFNVLIAFRKLFFLNKFKEKIFNKSCVFKKKISIFQKFSKSYFNLLKKLIFLKNLQKKFLYNVRFFLKNIFGGGILFFNFWKSKILMLSFFKNNLFFLEMQKNKKEPSFLKLFKATSKKYRYNFSSVYFICITINSGLKSLKGLIKFSEQKIRKKYFYKKIKFMKTKYKKPIRVAKLK